VVENAADAGSAETASRPSPVAKRDAPAIPSAAANDAAPETGDEPNEGAEPSEDKNSSSS
jgi:hypothetical protein